MIAEDAQLHAMLTRLPLSAIRDRLDALLEEAVRRDLDLRQTPTHLCTAEVEHRDQRRIAMGTSPWRRTPHTYTSSSSPAATSAGPCS